MGKQFSILLTDEAYQVVSEYMKDRSCTRNKAINELITANKNNTLTAKVQKLLVATKKIYDIGNKNSTLLQSIHDLLQK